MGREGKAGAIGSGARGSILLEEATVTRHDHHPGGQHVLSLHAPRIAARAHPGSFVHLRCDPGLLMRRPFSIMDAAPDEGEIELLYKEAGLGTRLLATRAPGETLSTLGPIGTGFSPFPGRSRALLLGGGVGVPPIVFLARWLFGGEQGTGGRGDGTAPAVATRAVRAGESFAALGSELPLPLATAPPRLPVPGLDGEGTALAAGRPVGGLDTVARLEALGLPCRIASRAGIAGAWSGLVTDLARVWLEALSPRERAEVAVYGCGPQGMLAAVAALADELGLPCQLAVEEYMACGVGGCAGCAVPVRTPEGTAMRRVCVDGPVFDAAELMLGEP